jgi:N-acetylneuraminate lyase
MNMQPILGIITALLTPFDEDERIDDRALSALVDFQVRQEVQGLYVSGSTGEAMLQSRAEREHCLKLVAQANAGRLRLIAHVGTISTADVLYLSEQAAAFGYEAISAIPPFYYPFSSREVTDHYREIARHSALPLIVYNFPAQTKGFSTAELIELLSTPRIIGVKHTSSDLFSLERTLRHKPEAIIYNGYDEMCLAGLAMGAQGAIGTTYNFMGDLFVEMSRQLKAGNLDRAQALQKLANDIIEQIIRFGVIPASKAILESFGLQMGSARRPFRAVTNDERRSLSKALEPLLAWRTGAKAA